MGCERRWFAAVLSLPGAVGAASRHSWWAGGAAQLQERQQEGRPGSGAWPGAGTSAVTSMGFMGERASSVSSHASLN